mgnify:CR=1 FL=1
MHAGQRNTWVRRCMGNPSLKKNTETGFLVFANDGRNGTLARSHDPGGTKQVAGIGRTNTELTATTLVAWTQTMQKQIAIAAYGLH